MTKTIIAKNFKKLRLFKSMNQTEFAELFDIALMIWSWGYPLLIARTMWCALYLAIINLETFCLIYVLFRNVILTIRYKESAVNT